MSENKFTPGPWEVVENPPSENGGTATSIYGGANSYVADVYCGYVGSESMSRTEASANARLIAAAPELFAEVEREYTELADIHNSWPGRDSPAGQHKLGRLRDLIAKATGRDPQAVQDDYGMRATKARGQS